MKPELIRELNRPAQTKIVLLILDGLGGLPAQENGLTELETARTPHLDSLAAKSICGLHMPVGPGITPGSGPSHLAVFGYDPIEYQVGRGVLSALGSGFPLSPADVAARGNFCTLDEKGRVSDRRAGRISSQKNQELCKLLQLIELPDVELMVKTVKEHRFLLVLRGEDLSGEVSDTDPHQTGTEPVSARALSPAADRAADLVNAFAEQAREILKDHTPANMVILRGFSQRPDWPSMEDRFGVKAAAIAAYPMYRGLAQLLGMAQIETGEQFIDSLDTLAAHWDQFDFFYVHVKHTDSAGEDGDFEKKVHAIEQVDAHVPRLLDIGPDVLVVTGDHSTPALQHNHSWHPVPVLLWSQYCRPDGVTQFGERACLAGGLGPRLPAVDLMPLMLANANRLKKFGA